MKHVTRGCHNTFVEDGSKGSHDNILVGSSAGSHLVNAQYCIGIGRGALSDVTDGEGLIEVAGVRREDPELAKALVPILRALIKDAGDGLVYVMANDELRPADPS
jgi:hypothetical protein